MANESIKIVVAFAGLILIAFVGKRAGWFQIVGGTNKLLREQNQELRNQNDIFREQIASKDEQHAKDMKDWQEKHTESVKQIGILQGKIETLTTIPLDGINESLKEVVKIGQDNAESNRLIFAQLKSSANIAARQQTDGGLKVTTEESIGGLEPKHPK